MVKLKLIHIFTYSEITIEKIFCFTYTFEQFFRICWFHFCVASKKNVHARAPDRIDVRFGYTKISSNNMMSTLNRQDKLNFLSMWERQRQHQKLLLHLRYRSTISPLFFIYRFFCCCLLSLSFTRFLRILYSVYFVALLLIRSPRLLCCRCCAANLWIIP